MTPDKILEGNKLIAEFMGVTMQDVSMVHYPEPNKEWRIRFPNGLIFEAYGVLEEIISKYAKYDLSFDWLMPVVEKICELDNGAYQFEIKDKSGFISSTKVDFTIQPYSHRSNIQASAETTIEAVWQTVVNFINWFNQKTTIPHDR